MQLSIDEFNEFRVEAFELIDQAEKSLLALDAGGKLNEEYDAIFRAFHNLKGTAGMLEMVKLQAHMHELETIFVQNKETGALSQELLSFFLKGCDVARTLFSPPEEIATEDKPKSDGIPADFWAECEELTEKISRTLPVFEKGQASAELLDSLYRDVHTIKGSAQLFGLSDISRIAHTMEAPLGILRDGGMPMSQPLVELLFSGIGLIENLIDHLKGQVAEAKEKYIQELPRFEALSKSLSPANTSSPKESAKAVVSPAPVEASQDSGNDASSSIRVPVVLLDKLMTLMGEMVLVRNQVLQYSSQGDDLEFLNLSQRLDVVTSEIQSEMMKTRMQPIGNILTKFQRLVRDLGKELGKKMELKLQGTETELDKTLLEAVKDPLTHIIRNACDHGMETPDKRLAMGKPECGTISVRAFHEGGQVIIEIHDDGRGLNRDVLLKKALEKNLISPEKAASMSEREVFALIFMPGFSTASHVTNISGRGVGMDVVRSNIDRIGGMVEIHSKHNEGTTICLKIPLTLAIVPAMIVRCGEDRYAIPQVKLVELLRVEAATSDNRIEYLQGKAVLRLRGKLLPLLGLRSFLQFTESEDPASVPGVANIVVLRSESQMFGLIVDEIQDTADIVVKPLHRFLKSLNVYSGATVLGDGSVALILDVLGIAHRMMLTSVADSSAQSMASENPRSSDSAQEFLLFRLNSPSKHAIPLDLVHRLEEFSSAEMEVSGGQKVMRYRGQILPILSMNEYLGYPAPLATETGVVPVIVTQKSNRYFGIQVSEILDVLNTSAAIEEDLSDRPGVIGGLISGQEVITIVDSLKMIDDIAKPKDVGIPKTAMSKKILYVEDNAFFRKHVTSILEKAGHHVSTAPSGVEAMETLRAKQRAEFDVVLSDIEMPRMNGVKLAENIRSDGRWNQIPMIALTTKFDEKARQTGMSAGFDLYLEKLNPAELLANLEKLANRRAS